VNYILEKDLKPAQESYEANSVKPDAENTKDDSGCPC